jgi:hypothetical protein
VKLTCKPPTNNCQNVFLAILHSRDISFWCLLWLMEGGPKNIFLRLIIDHNLLMFKIKQNAMFCESLSSYNEINKIFKSILNLDLSFTRNKFVFSVFYIILIELGVWGVKTIVICLNKGRQGNSWNILWTH